MAKNQTNVEFVTELMEFSRFGALSQMFVIAALDSYSKKVAATPLEDMPKHGFINSEAWQGVAKEIQQKFTERKK